MRIVSILAGVAAVALAVSASAQESTPEQTGSETQTETGLDDLSETGNDLSDQPATEAGEGDAVETESVTPEAAQSEAVDPPAPAATPPEASTEPSVEPAPLSAEQRAELDQAAVRGRQLFAIARAGMLATQDMLSRVADPEAAGISGWVAEPEGNAMAVTFYGDGENGPVAIYRARILGARAVSRETFLTGDRPPLAGVAARMAQARAVSGADDQRACTEQPFNVLAIPPESSNGPIHVYRISAPESRTRLPLGGHFRSTVSSDGEVSESRAFSRGCLNVDIGEVRPGTQAGPIAVTHLLDPLPTEIHVFLSLFSGRPLVIAAGDPTRLFMVAGDAIREIRR